MSIKKDVNRLINGKIIISNYVKGVKQIEGVIDYIRELPRDLSVKDWIKIQEVNNALIYGEQEIYKEI